MNSAIYKGWVRHRRSDGVAHQFQYRVFMALIDLAELAQLEQNIVGFSTRGWTPISLRRDDHAGPDHLSLEEFVKNKVTESGVDEPIGAIRLLTNLRWFGHCFNPLSVYYCYAADKKTLCAAVLEVTNTPWGERHCYVIDMTRPDSIKNFDKSLHVSPFFGMDMRYSSYIGDPAEVLSLALNNIQSQSVVHRASLVLKREPLTSKGLWLAGLGEVSMTLKVKWRIHWQALRLFIKGARFYKHPARDTD